MRATTLATLATLVTLITFVTLTAAAPTKPNTSPLLIVLRSGCYSNDSRIFSEHALQNFMVSSKRDALLSRPFQILSYKETCGVKSEERIARAGLASVASGGAVVSAGWPGGAACSALAAAARAWSRRAPPAACATPPARAAVLALLARRLRWRLAHLPPPRDASDQCTAFINEAERALLAAGLLVRRASPDIDNIQPYVSVLCDDQYSSKQANKLKQGNNIVSILILSSSAPASAPAPAPAPATSTPLHTRNLKIVNGASDLDPYEKTSPSPTSEATFAHKNQINISIRLTEPATGDDSLETRGLKRRMSIDTHNDQRGLFDTNTLNSIGLNPAEYPHSLVLTDVSSEASTFDDLLNVLQSHYDKTEIVNNTFQLFESKVTDGSPRWVRVSLFVTKSLQSTDHSWDTDVSWEGNSDFDVWCSEHTAPSIMEMYGVTRAARDVHEAASAVCVAGAALVALAAIALTIFATRRSLARRMQRRPRAAVILLAADFQFPADEQRRVGEGMESMLSWLQQLHDLSGSESNKPDLLKRPTAPSAPSSTCSVTRLPPDGRIRYKGDPVHMKYFPAASLELKRKAIDVLLVMQSLRHENLNPFIGCLCSVRPALVFEVCGRGSLEDVLVADDIRLDWTFRLSLLTDLVRGMRYLHASPLRLHGRLSSRNCVIDSRWVLRVTDYGLPHIARAQPLPTATRSARELLWYAPEILRAGDASQVTQAGDVFSFSIIMQEVIVRGEPYCMLSLTPEEIVEKLCHPPPLIRPSVSMGAAPPEAVSVMRQCWSEQPDLRPDFNRLYDIFRHLHRGRKVNIVDSMFEMLEKYSNNLEELIKERTEQLDVEKKKTEQLLNRMLPRSVAERLMLGLRVQPEEFEEVSIYFSDIVGFTSIAARSTPVQVVDLLNDLYTTFDATIEQYRVYKVETIGDAYMVVGGLPLRCTDHAESVATMALHLLHLAGRFRIRHSPGTPLHLRIGLHTGPCCAGVVGLTMPRYCLFGDTVNTASRMESTGAAWRVQVSDATAERLMVAGGYRLRSRGLTQVKGKGAMHTYWLLGKEGFEKSLPTPPPLESEEVLFETECENDSESSDQSGPGRRTASTDVPHADAGAPISGHNGWVLPRSGAVSAESSPPALPARVALSTARYRYMRASLSTCSVAGVGLSAPPATSGARMLRRQWSLERGDVLAAAAAVNNDAPTSSDSTLEPLALRAPPPRPAPPRYRTRPEISHSQSGDSDR